jgi:hypothetical protein
MLDSLANRAHSEVVRLRAAFGSAGKTIHGFEKKQTLPLENEACQDLRLSFDSQEFES